MRHTKRDASGLEPPEEATGSIRRSPEEAEVLVCSAAKVPPGWKLLSEPQKEKRKALVAERNVSLPSGRGHPCCCRNREKVGVAPPLHASNARLTLAQGGSGVSPHSR